LLSFGWMNSDEQLRLIDRFYDDMWNRFDKSVFGAILDPKIHFRGSLGQTKVGFEAAVFTFSDGLISDVWVLGDIHGLTRQLSIEAT